MQVNGRQMAIFIWQISLYWHDMFTISSGAKMRINHYRRLIFIFYEEHAYSTYIWMMAINSSSLLYRDLPQIDSLDALSKFFSILFTYCTVYYISPFRTLRQLDNDIQPHLWLPDFFATVFYFVTFCPILYMHRYAIIHLFCTSSQVHEQDVLC